MKKIAITAFVLSAVMFVPANAQNQPLEDWKDTTLVIKLATEHRIGILTESIFQRSGAAIGQWYCIYDNGNEILMKMGAQCKRHAYVG